MSNTDTAPVEIRCRPGDLPVRDAGNPLVDVLTSRAVPLGGPRAMQVRRTLPQRRRSLLGAWCFVDHYGPDDVSITGGMDVAPHPHTGLQTLSWLFTGEIEHRDTHGVHAMVRSGEMNLMTGGYGIAHSEVSTSHTTTLHGVQLWLALPDAARDAPRDFQHHVPEAIDLGGATGRIFLGTLGNHTSPVYTFSPLLGAEIVLEPNATISLEVNPQFEHGILVDTGTVDLFDTTVQRAELGCVGTGVPRLMLANRTDETARLLLLGGTPFGEDIVMWWNFVARDHDEIVAFREEWERESDRFGQVAGYQGTLDRLPAPALPNARIRPRRNPPPTTARG